MTLSDGEGGTATQDIVITVNGSNDTPTLQALTLGYTDTAADDTFAAQDGTLTAADADAGTTLTFSLAGSVASDLSGFDLMAVGTYGTLHIDSLTGDYRYVPVDSAVEALTGPATDSFSVTVSDGAASATQSVTVNIAGAQDTPFFQDSMLGGFTVGEDVS